MTGSGAGALATIQLCGDAAEDVLRAVFRRADGKTTEFTPSLILLGDIVEGEQPVDQITIGCEGPGVFAIHCHGNPLIVERVMGLLQSHGVQPVRPEQLWTEMLSLRERKDSIAIEAKQALITVKTVEGARIIANQVKAGLAARARQWQANLDSISLEQMAAEAKQILKDSDIARLILAGCTIVLIGPPNTGKSTLLNALAGREKAVVTDIQGTTRDWVSAEVHIPPLAVTLIDTAGLDPSLTTAGDIDETAQHKSIEAVNCADLILLILDASQSVDQLSASVTDLLVGRKVVTVLNKTDLTLRFDVGFLPNHLRHTVHISAKQEIGFKDLIEAIHQALGLTDFPSDAIVAFTARQRTLLERLATTESRSEAAAILAGFL